MADFFDWLGENSWAAWASAGVILAILEVLGLQLVFLMLAVGAFGGAVTSALGAPEWINVLVAIVVAVAMLSFVRPSVLRRLQAGPELRTGHAALVGTSAIVTASIGDRPGQVRLAGEIWTARSYDPMLPISSGTHVTVFEIDGATAVVYPDQ